jgi:hypothetical protein
MPAPQVEFRYLPEERILVVRTSGLLVSSSWPDVIRMATEEGKGRGCLRYLVDHREAELRFRFADLWILPRNAGHFELPEHARIAMLLPHPHATRKAFIEAFMGNRGFDLKVFADTDSAISWLTEPSRPKPFTFS